MKTTEYRFGMLIKLGLTLLIFQIGCSPTGIRKNPGSATKFEILNMAPNMPTFVIEREIPGAGSLTKEELKAASHASCSILKEMGPDIQWLHSYVTENKVYCVYKARNPELIEEHARKVGVPANSISQISTVIDPATAEQR